MTASPPSPAVRTQADRCPGLLRPHRAADGALVRLRLPGGAISASALSEVSLASATFGDGQVQLTSRGNLQLRGVPVDGDGEVPQELVDRIVASGLLPSASHELVRNIVCSPLTGRSGGRADLRALPAELDRLVCADPELAELPGRFLFALDDGRGDVVTLAHDLGILAVDRDHVALSAAGLIGSVIPIERAADALVNLARRFIALRGTAWHVRELAGGPRTLVPDATAPAAFDVHPLEYGRMTQTDGRRMLSLGVPLATLTAGQVESVTTAAQRWGSGTLVVTPWRGLLLPDLDEEHGPLELEGFLLDRASPWRGLTACTGAPGCVSASGATRPVAAHLAEMPFEQTTLDVHVVACERRCGSPSTDHVEVLVRPDGFTVSVSGRQIENNCDADRLAGIVALARNSS